MHLSKTRIKNAVLSPSCTAVTRDKKQFEIETVEMQYVITSTDVSPLPVFSTSNLIKSH